MTKSSKLDLFGMERVEDPTLRQPARYGGSDAICSVCSCGGNLPVRPHTVTPPFQRAR